MVKAVVGANWGDEGKGKITDTLAEQADIVVRFQGGANAGHTIVNNYGKFALHTLPSGVFYGHTTSIIGNGVALNIPILVEEIKSITDRDVPKGQDLFFQCLHTCKSLSFLIKSLRDTGYAQKSHKKAALCARYPSFSIFAAYPALYCT